jgi:hypothetical protein
MIDARRKHLTADEVQLINDTCRDATLRPPDALISMSFEAVGRLLQFDGFDPSLKQQLQEKDIDRQSKEVPNIRSQKRESNNEQTRAV